MIIYLTIISITILIIFFINFSIGNFNIIYIFLNILFNIIYILIIDAFLAWAINQLPEKWFNYNYKRFKIFKWEKKFYEAIKIKKWKEKIPELGQLANFKKDKIKEPFNNQYINKYLLECVYGEMVHLISIFFGFIIILFNLKEWYIYCLPIAIANGIISYLSYAILRYNRPKLMTIQKRNNRIKERSKNIN